MSTKPSAFYDGLIVTPPPTLKVGDRVVSDRTSGHLTGKIERIEYVTRLDIGGLSWFTDDQLTPYSEEMTVQGRLKSLLRAVNCHEQDTDQKMPLLIIASELKEIIEMNEKE